MTLENILPQKGEMLLVDSVLTHGENSIECLFTATKARIDHCSDSGKLPLWLVFESLAQAAALIGALAGREIERGFLLGARELIFESEEVEPGTEILLKAVRIADNGAVSTFEGSAFEKSTGAALLSAKFSVIEEIGHSSFEERQPYE